MISNEIIKQFEVVTDKLKKEYGEQTIKDKLSVIAAMIKRIIVDVNIPQGGRWDGDEDNIGIFSGGKSKWKSLADSTIKQYKRKGWELEPILNRTKGLVSSIDVRAEGTKIIISSSKPYAAVHQFGYNTTPALPYITLTEQDLQDIMEVLLEGL